MKKILIFFLTLTFNLSTVFAQVPVGIFDDIGIATGSPIIVVKIKAVIDEQPDHKFTNRVKMALNDCEYRFGEAVKKIQELGTIVNTQKCTANSKSPATLYSYNASVSFYR